MDDLDHRRETLIELLEWRQSLAGLEWRPSWEYLEELRQLCAWGRIEVLGRPVLDALGVQAGEQQRVPADAFSDYRLVQGILSNHGELLDRLSAAWVDLRFPSDTRRVWREALDAGELYASRAAVASPPLAEDAQRAPVAPAKASGRKPSPGPRGKPPETKNRIKAEMREHIAEHGLEALKTMKQAEQAATFRASPRWCAEALKEVLAEIAATDAGPDTVTARSKQ